MRLTSKTLLFTMGVSIEGLAMCTVSFTNEKNRTLILAMPVKVCSSFRKAEYILHCVGGHGFFIHHLEDPGHLERFSRFCLP